MLKLEKMKEYYLISLFIMLLLRSINAYSLLPSKYDSIIFAVLGLLGGVFLLQELFIITKKRQLISFDSILLVFLFFLGVSILVNHDNYLESNIKLFVWTSLYLIGIYKFSERNYEKIQFIDLINKILIFSFFIMSVVSFLMYLLKFSYIYVYGSGPREHIRIGFLESRLFGVFGDPNYGATMALIVLILSFFYLIIDQTKKSLPIRVFFVFNIIIQFFIIILSGSRSALSISFVVVAWITFTYSFLLISKKHIRNIVFKIILSLTISLLMIAFYYGLQAGTKDFLKVLPEHINYELKVTNDSNSTKEKKNLKFNRESNKQSEISLTRKDVAENEDISNMRFSIWKSAIEIFKSTPWIGTSPRNIIVYANKNIPTTFIAQKAIVVHNAYINVLVSTGILGFLPFIIFLIVNGLSVLIFFFKNKEKLPNYFNSYLSILLVLVLSGLFNNELVLVNTVGTFIFWLYLGNLNGYMKGMHLLDGKSKNES
ncbi:O-antigen ligase family protein [Enterococcus dongliensis]|uniref:O-antigen ligase family protein n=1 Tax=Enterococcus dongliensis TaxID=2559925 RepID=A0AAW8TM82_9ENTE|nr:O-antigen ligase family protein [Enterococcus dongliensis]MDT2638334.1 O-antigen ligase family protein [Enterococcus dongliensis]MDT2673514.1 O-antigen ligase family protein [Enterococcus dongliensis]